MGIPRILMISQENSEIPEVKWWVLASYELINNIEYYSLFDLNFKPRNHASGTVIGLQFWEKLGGGVQDQSARPCPLVTPPLPLSQTEFESMLY